MPKYTNQERKGIIMLLVVALMALMGPQLVLYYASKNQVPLVITNIPFDTLSVSDVDYKTDNNWNDWSDWDNKGDDKRDDEINPYKVKERFTFNPNTINYDSLLRLGFSTVSAKTLIKARDGGFVFRKEKDLLKIYNIDSNLVQSLSLYVKYDLGLVKNEFVALTYPKAQIEIIEINSADSSQWEQLPNIGAGTIYKINKHKKALGGFISINQLKEDKIVNDTVFDAIIPYLTVDKSKIKKLNINIAVFRDLIKHPYLDAKAINAIVNYREQNGGFKDPKDIRKIISLSKTVGAKILPYLGVE